MLCIVYYTSDVLCSTSAIRSWPEPNTIQLCNGHDHILSQVCGAHPALSEVCEALPVMKTSDMCKNMTWHHEQGTHGFSAFNVYDLFKIAKRDKLSQSQLGLPCSLQHS